MKERGENLRKVHRGTLEAVEGDGWGREGGGLSS